MEQTNENSNRLKVSAIVLISTCSIMQIWYLLYIIVYNKSQICIESCVVISISDIVISALIILDNCFIIYCKAKWLWTLYRTSQTKAVFAKLIICYFFGLGAFISLVSINSVFGQPGLIACTICEFCVICSLLLMYMRSGMIDCRIEPEPQPLTTCEIVIESSTDCCSICIEPIIGLASQTKCKHNFHKHCLKNWAAIQSQTNKKLSCPNCRAEL